MRNAESNGASLPRLLQVAAKCGERCGQFGGQAIDWKSIPETMSPALYHRLKQKVLSLRDSGLVLTRLAEPKLPMEL